MSEEVYYVQEDLLFKEGERTSVYCMGPSLPMAGPFTLEEAYELAAKNISELEANWTSSFQSMKQNLEIAYEKYSRLEEENV